MERSSSMADVMAIERLINLYGHIVDNREWDRLGELFTNDLVFDSTDMGARLRTSLVELYDDWSKPDTPHPYAHHATNIVVEILSDDDARAVSKGIGLRPGGRVGSVFYQDFLRRTPAGWRICRRRAARRRDPGA